MKLQTFTLGCALVLAVFLFAKHRDVPQASSSFRHVVDLTKAAKAAPASGSVLEAPALSAPSLWTVDQIPAERLIAPLVVLDVRSRTKSDNYLISVDDIADWERAHGEIAPGAVVLAQSGRNEQGIGYSMDAARFLVEGRNVLGLGVDQAGVSPETDKYTFTHSVYRLENVANLDAVPASGSVVLIAPAKLQGAKVAPVRILAMVR